MMDSMVKCMAFSHDPNYIVNGYGNGGMQSYGDCLEGRFKGGGFNATRGDGYYRGRRGWYDNSSKKCDNIFGGQLVSNGGYVNENVHKKGVFDIEGDCSYVGLGKGLQNSVQWRGGKRECSQIKNKSRGNFRRQ